MKKPTEEKVRKELAGQLVLQQYKQLVKSAICVTSVQRLGKRLLSGDQHFINEALFVARAHVRGRGGNALIDFALRDVVLMESPAKNQGQCLVSLIGNVVLVVPPGKPVLHHHNQEKTKMVETELRPLPRSVSPAHVHPPLPTAKRSAARDFPRVTII